MGTKQALPRSKSMSVRSQTRFVAGLLLLFMLGVISGCSSAPPRGGSALPGSSAAAGTNTNSPVLGDTGSTLRIGDFITIAFTDIPVGPATTTMTREQRIRIPDDGMITLPYNVRVQAAGRSTSQLESEIRVKYVPDLFQSLTAIVTPEARFYYVGGEVKLPGKQAYVGNVTVLRAIETAGGFTDFARRSNIEVRRSNGKVEHVNWKKARKKSSLDVDIFPNDHVIVPRGF
jgi:polysaccharide biosynthesis/export protein VpsN